MKLKPSKCELFQTSVKYLGHIESEKGVSTDSSKIQSVAAWPTPSCPEEVRSFLGHVGYYRKYVPNFASIPKPLSRLTAKGVPFEWSDEAAEAFVKLRQALVESPFWHTLITRRSTSWTQMHQHSDWVLF